MNPRRLRLASRLREIRAAHHRSGLAFSQAIGWVQSRVSKLETGNQLPSEADIHAWVAACGEGDEVAEELLALLADVRVEYVNARDVQRSGGLAARQAELGAIEQRTSRIDYWQPGVVPGIVQTPDYMRDVLALPGGPATSGTSEDEIETIIAERVRRQNILYQRDKQITVIVGEAAFYAPPGSPATLRAQLDRLVTVAGLSTLVLAVLPLRARMRALPMGGYTIHDDEFVLIETLTAEMRVEEPDEVKTYRECFDHLLAGSATGPDAIDLIRTAVDG